MPGSVNGFFVGFAACVYYPYIKKLISLANGRLKI